MHAILMLALAQGGGDTVLSETVVSTIAPPRSRDTVTSTEAKHVVVSGAELLQTGAETLPQAIGLATGVWVQQTNLGGGAPVIRGLLGNKVLIVVDGVRMNDSTTRLGPNQSLNTIDPYIVDRVEVIRGARSLLYGSDAIGGVVLIWTKRRQPLSRMPGEAFAASFGAQGDTAYGGGRAALETSFATPEHGLLAIGSLHDYDDLTGADSQTIPNTGYGGFDLFGAWEWALDEARTLRTTARMNRDTDVPRSDKLNVGFGQTEPTHERWSYSLQDRRVFQVAYDDRVRGGLADEWQVNLSVRQYEEQRDLQLTGGAVQTAELDQVSTLSLTVDWATALGSSHLLTWGVDAANDDVDSSRVDTDTSTGGSQALPGAFAPESRYSALGAFVQDEVLSLDPWFLTLGLRYSYYDFSFLDAAEDVSRSGNFDALVASVDAARELGEGYVLTATLAQGFRAPNLEDLANESSFASGTELGNPDLDPERSLTGELTFAADRPLWGGTLAGFYTQIDDFIGRTLLAEGDPDQTGDELYLRTNSGDADIWGVEGTFRLRLVTRDSPFELRTRIAYAQGQQFDPAVDPETGEQPLYDVPFRRIPPLHGRVGLRYARRGAARFFGFGELYVLWAADQDRLNPEDVSDPRIDPTGTPGWATVNVDVGGPLTDGVVWNAGLHNITDEQYRVHGSGIDAPGLSLVLGVQANF